jgi:hypothetical protein
MKPEAQRAKSKAVSIRLVPELIAIIDRYADHMSRQIGIPLSRSDAFRLLLTETEKRLFRGEKNGR